MKIHKLDHFNIVANKADLERVIKFYNELLGFEEGPRPADLPAGGIWLYKDEFPLVHLSETDGPDLETPGLHDTTTGCVHHIAFDCEGIEEFRAALEQKGIEYMYEAVTSWNIQQLFFHDPAGTRIELNFKNG